MSHQRQGADHPSEGNEWPRAYLLLKDEAKGSVNEDQIQEWIKPRVAKHKYLRGGVVFVDEIPRLASGKIQRKTLREWANRDAAAIMKRGQVAAKL